MKKVALMVLMVAATTAVGRTCPCWAQSNINGTAGVSMALQQTLQQSIRAKIAYNDIYEALVASGQDSEQEIEQEEIVEIEYEDINIYNPYYTGWKTWMSYTAITNTNSKQYALQLNCYTGKYGIRMYDDRYCIAVGTGTGCEVGDYVDLILENGAEIPCIVSDIKASQHTTDDNIFTNVGLHLCASEFVVDKNLLDEAALISGDISTVCEEWQSKVITIRKYQRTEEE